MLPYARLLAALEDIRDPRRGQGKRYTLPPMLLFAVLAVLAGATSYQSIITFISLHRERLNQIFGARFRRAPALNTLRNLILALDPADLEAAFRRHARGLYDGAAGQGLRTVALDGWCAGRSKIRPPGRWKFRVLPHFACCWICLVAHRVKPDPP